MKSFKRKQLRMRIFHKNKDSRSKDQNKNELHFISPAMKTYINRIFFHDGTKFYFRYHVSTLLLWYEFVWEYLFQESDMCLSSVNNSLSLNWKLLPSILNFFSVWILLKRFFQEIFVEFGVWSIWRIWAFYTLRLK